MAGSFPQITDTFVANRQCKCIRRRDLLRIGALTPFGIGLIDLLRGRAAALDNASTKARSCILIWLDGGPSHLETFDVKTDVPEDVRGPFRPIATNVPGIQISELLPKTAQVADKLTIIRSMTSPLGEHGLANHYLLTGYKPSPVLEYPSYGAVLSHVRQQESTLPPYIGVPDAPRAAGSGYLGSAHRPFVTGGDPATPDFRVNDLDFFPGVTTARMERRRAFLQDFDRAQAAFENVTPQTDAQFEQAYRLITSTDAKRAFRLDEEPAEVRARYGPRTLGQSCLLARRLVERGVPFVTVFNEGWDTHDSLVVRLRDGYAGARVGVGLIPTFDLAFAALIRDLAERHLLDQTLVIAMGEFGRTPKINTQGGRDHWPRVFSVVLAGGGVPGGQVIGASDRTGESPSDNPVTPSDLACTIYHQLGIDPSLELHTSDGRPVRVNQGGGLIRGIAG